MHEEILNGDQQKLLPLMAQFRREYYLVGGTAIALHLGHRRSIDFDMFKMSAINHKKNLDKIVAAGFEHLVTRRVEEQMNLLVETTLNYGTLDDFRELRDILTPRRMAQVFFSATGRKANNYYPEIRHFYSLVLKPYA